MGRKVVAKKKTFSKSSLSAGILAYRKRTRLEVLLVHPGGPFWRKKDGGAWSIPKGEIDALEDFERAARREFADELGPTATIGSLQALGDIRQRGGKRASSTRRRLPAIPSSSEWPPRTGRRQEFPEVDRAAWFDLPTARTKLLPAQVEFLDRLLAIRCSWSGLRMMFSIGIISDTHGLLRPEAERCLTGVDHIIHGGDIGRPEIVEALRKIAPVTAIRGNVDSGDWARDYPDTELVNLAGKSIYVLHDLKTLKTDPRAQFDVIVSGHSHVPKIDAIGGVLYVNPGSAGPRRFRLPITLATLEVTLKGMRPRIHDLGDG